MTKEFLLIVLMAAGYGLVLCGTLSFGRLFVKVCKREEVSRPYWIASSALMIGGLLLVWLAMSRA